MTKQEQAFETARAYLENHGDQYVFPCKAGKTIYLLRVPVCDLRDLLNDKTSTLRLFSVSHDVLKLRKISFSAFKAAFRDDVFDALRGDMVKTDFSDYDEIRAAAANDDLPGWRKWEKIVIDKLRLVEKTQVYDTASLTQAKTDAVIKYGEAGKNLRVEIKGLDSVLCENYQHAE